MTEERPTASYPAGRRRSWRSIAIQLGRRTTSAPWSPLWTPTRPRRSLMPDPSRYEPDLVYVTPQVVADLTARVERAEAENERLNDVIKRVVAFRNLAMGWTEQLRDALTTLADAVEVYMNADAPAKAQLQALDRAERSARTTLFNLPPRAALDGTDNTGGTE